MTKNNSGFDRKKILIGVDLLAVFILVVLVYYLNDICLNVPGIIACQRILFIGDSFTFANDLPQVFADLARSGGHQVQTGMAATGGWTLADHVASSATLGQLRSNKWDYVVLQEQSEIPAFEQSRSSGMYPAARQLVHQIEVLGSTPIFSMTWAHQAGMPENGFPDYQSMQFEIDRGYLGIAQELNVPVAPVGYAWMIAYGQIPQLNLWQEDGSHPSPQGTYLAACVFYAAIFRQSPEGLKYLDQQPPDLAKELQAVAATIVLKNPKQWNLP